MSDNVKAIDTPTLKKLISDAAKRNYNRQIDPEVFKERADPDGVHVLQSLMTHLHAGGQVTEPHARCRVLIKVKGHELPGEAWLDVALKKFMALPDLDTIMGQLDGGPDA